MIGDRPTCPDCGDSLDLPIVDAEMGKEYELDCDTCQATVSVMPDTRVEWNEQLIEPGDTEEQ